MSRPSASRGRCSSRLRRPAAVACASGGGPEGRPWGTYEHREGCSKQSGRCPGSYSTYTSASQAAIPTKPTYGVPAKPQRARRMLPVRQRPGALQPRQHRRHACCPRCRQRPQQQLRIVGAGWHRQPSAKHLPIEQQQVASGVTQWAAAGRCPTQLQQRPVKAQVRRAAQHLQQAQGRAEGCGVVLASRRLLPAAAAAEKSGTHCHMQGGPHAEQEAWASGPRQARPSAKSSAAGNAASLPLQVSPGSHATTRPVAISNMPHINQ